MSDLQAPHSGTAATLRPRTLIAGFGSSLHGDDGFGVDVIERLEASGRLPPGVELADIGTGGIHLVHRLLDGYDNLLIVDAARQGGRPGTLYLLEPQVADLQTWAEEERQAYCADMHYTEPSRALILAKALGVLPERTLILGCEPGAVDDLAVGLSPPVERAAGAAAVRINQLLEEWGCHTVGAGV